VWPFQKSPLMADLLSSQQTSIHTRITTNYWTLYSSVISHFLILLAFLLLPQQYSFILFIILLFKAFFVLSLPNKNVFYNFCFYIHLLSCDHANHPGLGLFNYLKELSTEVNFLLFKCWFFHDLGVWWECILPFISSSSYNYLTLQESWLKSIRV